MSHAFLYPVFLCAWIFSLGFHAFFGSFLARYVFLAWILAADTWFI